MAKLCVSFTLLHAFYTRFTLFFCGHPDPEIRGEPSLKKNSFWPFRAHFNLKIIKARSPPLDPPLQHTFVNVVILVFYHRFARILCDLMAYLNFYLRQLKARSRSFIRPSDPEVFFINLWINSNSCNQIKMLVDISFEGDFVPKILVKFR